MTLEKAEASLDQILVVRLATAGSSTISLSLPRESPVGAPPSLTDVSADTALFCSVYFSSDSISALRCLDWRT